MLLFGGMELMSKTILVVDDDPEVCNLLKSLLISEDRVVHTAVSMAEAQAALQNGDVDLLLLDLYLPDGNGIDFLEMKKEHPCTIVMTAYGSWDTHVKAYRCGAYYFLDKPFKITQVRSLVDQALRGKAVQ
jgi:two-component system, NtrC family, response regulator PilR